MFDELTALTDLWLQGNFLSTLPAGVFDELTALTELELNGNSLSTLPAGVFDELTALTTLNLSGNSLSTLPAGVFDELTALTTLRLEYNTLSTLPAGVFDELTALDELWLQINPGAPFSPTADALPDDGEVSFAGGDVTLDGSGSDGGPWGTNVTYSWALTSPTSGVTVTFDDAASATPVVTIPALADGTELTFTLTVTGRATNTTLGSAPDTDTATVTAVFDATAGICGRTEEVRDAIVGEISGVTHCALVTDAHLAAITGTLDLESKNITALAAGDFDGLTALTTLNLFNTSLSTLPAGVFDGLTALDRLLLHGNSLSTLPAGVFDGLTALTNLELGVNSLSTLPAGVFDGLTALTQLRLDHNSLSTLPVGVFDELTALTRLDLRDNSLSTLPAGVFEALTALTDLSLRDNSLSTLPAGVFEALTALTDLSLQGNPGAPFSPTAVALPDDGEVVVGPGGTVTLDGSDGGPWGTNVTYSWAASGATVTFDDAASATPVVTIPVLADGTELTFTLTVTGRATNTSRGTAPATDTATVTAVFDSTAGICGRTEEVRTAIVGLISGVASCADVTDAQLAAITGTLRLGAENITALAVGDFDGLTALTTLRLRGNSLSTLPAGVFDKLTALTTLDLRNNSLSTLPAGVFEALTALTATLRLDGNLGAPFAPTADALPDDGEVLDAGGDVTLDGSGSDGGPWGTNVTYSWAASGAAVTFDDAASATPVVTIPALADGTELTFTLTVTGRATNASFGSAPATDTATVTAEFDPTAGICGRTEVVRDRIVNQISGVTHCALVTDVHLAAITGILAASPAGITALAAGDFDGLTALTQLWLHSNSLSTLPAGVFDDLTALTTLILHNNDLTALPAGVFNDLTALTTLELNNNDLSTLDDDVFEPLTALTQLRLQGNPGAPFAPTADALPDDGTVPVAGGDVTLDGSGSDGGPWGTNVTYSWAASGATVTFDDAASATPVVTIPALAAGTELTFTLTVTGRAHSAAYGSARDTDTATVTAVGVPELSFAPNSVTVNEDAVSATLTVELDPASTGTVTVDYATRDGVGAAKAGEDYTATSGTLTFAATETSKTFTVPILDDDVYENNESFSVDLTNPTGATLVASGATVRIDSEDAVPTVSMEDVTVDEGAGTMTLTLRLSHPSDADITYLTSASTVTGTATEGDDYDDFLLGPGRTARITVPAGDLSQTFDITIVDDSVDEPDETIDIGWQKSVSAEAIPITFTFIGTFTDNDTAGVTVSKTSLTVTEADTTGDSYTVVLDSQPTASVVVTVAGHAGTEVLPAPTTLTFTSTTWNTPQPVTVTAADDTDTANDTVSLTHSAASTDSNYDAIVIGGVTVTVEDPDTAQVTGVMVAPGNAQLTVGWAAVANATGYEVQWKSGGQSYNTSDRQATVASGSTTSHTLPGLANDTEYTVRVRATRTGANDGPYSDEAMATPKAAGVTVSKTSLTVTEADTTGDSYTVVLDNQPTASVVVTVAGHAGTEVLPAPTTLTFTSTTWNTPQPVTVTAADDTDTANDEVTLTHSAASTDSDYDAIVIGGVTVTVEDHDTAQVTGVMVAPGNARLTVGWAAVANATGYEVQWKSGGQSYNTSDRQATVASGSTTSHTLPGLANATAYTVRVRATRTGANDGPYSDEAMATPKAAGVTVSETALTVTEEDTTGDSYTVVLDSQPTANVVVTVAGHAGTEVLPAPTTLTFTSTTWNTPQLVTVTAADDTDTANDEVTLTHSAASTDSDYDAIVIGGVTVTVEDNDTAQVTGVMVAPGNARLTVGWAAVANATGYEVQWKSGRQSYNTSDRQATVASGSTTSHTLPGLANDTEYTVRVRATRTGANDGPYSDEEMATPKAAGVTVSETALTVTEEDTTGDSYTVVLDNQPTANVVVTVAGHAGTEVLPAPTTLTFTSTTWNTPQLVTVTAADDTDTANDEVTLTHSATSTDTDYSGITIGGVTVTVEDNDTANSAPTFTSAATFDAAENQTAVGTVQASDGDADDTVTGYAIQGGADASTFSIVPATGVLTFGSAPNFEAPADADTDNAYVVVVRATSGTGDRVKTADQTITVTVTDVAGEAPGVPAAPMVSAASVTSVTAAWTAPANAGPPITDYDYRYRVTAPQGSWTEVTTTTITALSATIAGLVEDTGYDVQVRATTDEGTSGWSASGSGSTDANVAPAFTSAATFDAAENQTAVGTVVASDGDADDTVTGYAIQGGADASTFSIVETTGVLTFASAPNFEAPADADTDNAYVVVVRATSGTGDRVKTADQTITVTVTDVAGEAPGVPAAPMVSAASVTSVTAAWTAPANAGPPITDYDYRYRVTAPQGSWDGGDDHDDHGAERDDRGARGGHRVRRAGAGDHRRGHERLVGVGQRLDGRERGAGVHLGGDVRRGGEPDRGGDGGGLGRRRGRHRDGLRDPGRRGCLDVLDRPRDWRPDVRVGAELRGPGGRGHGQRLRGGGAGDERHGRAGEDGGPDDHGDGDGRGRRGAGRTGRADGDGGVGDERDGGLDRARERRSADHGLRLPLPGDVAAGLVDGGDDHGDHRVERDDHGARGGHRVRRAGTGDHRRGHERLVRLGQRLDGRERGAGVHLGGDVRRGGEPDRGGDGGGLGRRRGRHRDGLRDPGWRGPINVLDRRDERGADVRVGAELRGPGGRGHG